MRQEILALIPARGGSKGIPRKNIRSFNGSPLIAWSIEAAFQSAFVTRTVVSTDDEEIAAIARKWGAETPFMRPGELAGDGTLDLPVFQHAVGWLAEHEDYRPEIIVQLRPTSPLRPRGCVDGAVRTFLSHTDADSVRGVVLAGQNPYKMWRLADEGPMKNLLNLKGIAEPYNAPRQMLPPVYWQTGHIDVIRSRTILNGSMTGKRVYPFIIDARYAIDLDSPYDWVRAEWVASLGDLDFLKPKARKGMAGK
jgi:CMP-N-acetylneuraminic acid synthetase